MRYEVIQCGMWWYGAVCYGKVIECCVRRTGDMIDDGGERGWDDSKPLELET
jgi:hypothetical protein